MKTQYLNRLPHIAPIGATFFVTFRMADSLPQSFVNALRAELESEVSRLKKEFPGDTQRISDARKRNFGKYDHQLDTKPYGACYLRLPEVAEIVAAKMRAYDGSLYDLQAYSIMPNHVHVLFSMATQVVDKDGFWPDEVPEHYVRKEEEWLNIAMYLLQNPVKAGLSNNWEAWPFNFCKPELLDYLLFRT